MSIAQIEKPRITADDLHVLAVTEVGSCHQVPAHTSRTGSRQLAGAGLIEDRGPVGSEDRGADESLICGDEELRLRASFAVEMHEHSLTVSEHVERRLTWGRSMMMVGSGLCRTLCFLSARPGTVRVDASNPGDGPGADSDDGEQGQRQGDCGHGQCRFGRLFREVCEAEADYEGEDGHDDPRQDGETEQVTIERLADGGECESDIGAGPAQEEDGEGRRWRRRVVAPHRSRTSRKLGERVPDEYRGCAEGSGDRSH